MTGWLNLAVADEVAKIGGNIFEGGGGVGHVVSLCKGKLWAIKKISGEIMVSKPLAHWRASDKTAQDLDVHLTNVGRLSGLFAAKIQLGSVGELMGLLHDIGKYSREFQGYIMSAEGLINPAEE